MMQESTYIRAIQPRLVHVRRPKRLSFLDPKTLHASRNPSDEDKNHEEKSEVDIHSPFYAGKFAWGRLLIEDNLGLSDKKIHGVDTPSAKMEEFLPQPTPPS